MSKYDDPRIGIIGPGGIGRVHAAALRSLGYDVSAVAASSLESAERHAQLLNAEAFPSGSALIHSRAVDVVHICTPNSTHATYSREAIANGLHVVSEKPLTTSATEAKALSELAAANPHLVTSICYAFRYSPGIRELRERISRGELGKAHLLLGSYILDEVLHLPTEHWMLDPLQMGPWLSLGDIGIHWWDLAEYVLDSEVAAVSAARASWRAGAPSQEDSASVLLRFSSGAIAAAGFSQVSGGEVCRFTLDVHGIGGQASWQFSEADPHDVNDKTAVAFRGLFADIYSTVRGETGGRYPTFEDGSHGVAVLEAVVRSTESKRWETVGSP